VGGAVFLKQLLAPARTGLIITRDDLRDAARELGLGLRVAERRYVLEGMFGQDAAAILEWLSVYAAQWSERHESEFWRRRAARSGALLRDAAGEARQHEFAHAG
jgi:hypothetical protein